MKTSLATEGPYALFDLQIGRARSEYRLHATGFPSGEATGILRLPFAVPDLVGDRKGRGRRNLRPARREAPTDPKAFGEALYRAVFTGRIGRLFDASLSRLAPGQALRLRLHLEDVPELSRLPWEYLRDPDKGLFLAQTSRISIVRYLGALDSGRPLPSAPPLEVLIVRAQPNDLPELAGEEEWAHIRAALAGKVLSRRAHLEILAGHTFEALVERLQQGPCHVLHFLGHGAFDVKSQSGTLFFEDDQGKGAPIDAGRLSTLLFDSEVRLVVLNACRGAEHSVDDAFTGVAQDLVRKGIPAVVAMQFDITDKAAVRFARKFYRPIALGAPVDFALAQARRELYFHGDDAEWGTPVLYTCSPDGHLFEIAPRHWGERLKETVARPAVLAAAALIVGVIAVDIHFRHAPVPLGQTPPPLVQWAPASPECPSPRGTDLRFVRIPSGKFVMGSDRKDETPAHEVEITRPFCMGQFEVTERQWREVMGDNPKPAQQVEDPLPKTNVSWGDTQLFLDRLNRREGRQVYRLPSEAEWEYTARATSTSAYSFGNEPSQLFLHGNCLSSDDHADGFERAAPVGQFRPNNWNLYDMYGNVWEWVGDWYGRDYSPGLEVDPKGPLAGVRRVRRGGGFKSSRDNCRSAVRSSSPPGRRMKDTGFRIVEALN